VIHNEAVSEVDETNSVSTSPIEEFHDESIWGVDETNSVGNETARNNGSTSRKTNFSLGSDFILISTLSLWVVVIVIRESDWLNRHCLFKQ